MEYSVEWQGNYQRLTDEDYASAQVAVLEREYMLASKKVQRIVKERSSGTSGNMNNVRTVWACGSFWEGSKEEVRFPN